MKALDTSVVVRHLLQDDDHQIGVAAEVLCEPCYLSHTVLMETVWVLRSSGKLSRQLAAEAAFRLIELPTVHIDDQPHVRWAVGRYATTGDFADLLHVVGARNADAFVTFDRRLAEQAGPDTPVPIETPA